ncbi:radial spoke head 10 homolog B-like [Schistocerca gregaria]|uniref:radial spoke head 10 homolog B-like n=1 Tax=Schistocerca gregaria TaxID=7010 RepID=UPI00211F45CD|nr:radial spoke head 10 homolog B-like [Schistocerca gregaria]
MAPSSPVLSLGTTQATTLSRESGIELNRHDNQGNKSFSSQVLEDVQQEEGVLHPSQIPNVSFCSITDISDESHWPKDGNAVLVFTNGILFEGHIKQLLMDGEGQMMWPDGSYYQGDFTSGQITGKGYIEWPDLSWYEGDVCLGYRHGLGMYRATFADVTYSGKWYMGCKEGPGMLYYSENVNNYYNGEWVQNERHGLGMRSYPSHACYYGQWMNGLQHGIGTMVWSNNDHLTWQRHRDVNAGPGVNNRQAAMDTGGGVLSLTGDTSHRHGQLETGSLQQMAARCTIFSQCTAVGLHACCVALHGILMPQCGRLKQTVQLVHMM